MTKRRDYGAILADATELNGDHARNKRRNNLNAFLHDVQGWLAHLDDRKKGPSLKESQRIVEDLRERLERIPDTEETESYGFA